MFSIGAELTPREIFRESSKVISRFVSPRNFVFGGVLTAFNYNETQDNLIKLMSGDIRV